MEKSKKIQKLLAYKGNPSLATFTEVADLNENIKQYHEAVNTHRASMERVQQLKGDKGEKGDQGEKGDTGPQGPEGKPGKDGKQGKDGLNGRDGRDGMDGIDGKDGRDGKDGKDGSPDTPKEIVQKLESLKGEERLDAKAIKNLPQFTREIVHEGFRAGAMETPIKDAITGKPFPKDASGAYLISAGSSGGGTWGSITGDINNQTDLQTQFNTKFNVSGGQFSGSVIAAIATLTDAATISVDASLGNQFTVTLGGNRTLGNPIGAGDGQLMWFVIRQDATGGRTLAFDTKYRFGDEIPNALIATGANKTTHIGVRYHQSDDKFDVVAFASNY